MGYDRVGLGQIAHRVWHVRSFCCSSGNESHGIHNLHVQSLFRDIESSRTLKQRRHAQPRQRIFNPVRKAGHWWPVFLANFSEAQLSWLGRLALPAFCQCIALHSVNHCVPTRLSKHSLQPSSASHLASTLPDSGRTITPWSFEAFARLAAGSATSRLPKSAMCHAGAEQRSPQYASLKASRSAVQNLCTSWKELAHGGAT